MIDGTRTRVDAFTERPLNLSSTTTIDPLSVTSSERGESNSLRPGPNGVRDHYATLWCIDVVPPHVLRLFRPALSLD